MHERRHRRRSASAARVLVLSLTFAAMAGCQALLVFERDDAGTSTILIGGDAASSPTDAGATADGKIVDASFDAAGYAGLVRSHRPLAYWRFGEAAGAVVAKDELGANDGTYNGCVLGVAGYSRDGNTAAKFTGTSWVTTTNAFAFEGNRAFTLEAWLYEPTKGADRAIMSRTNGADGYRLYIHRPGDQLVLVRMARGVPQESRTVTIGVVAGEVHHLVATYDGAAVFLFIDGIQHGNELSAVSIPSVDAPLVIGSESAAATATSFQGTIDEVAIYDRALSAAEVRAHFDAARHDAGADAQ